MRRAVILIVMILSACAPLPHTHKIAPRITGVVLLNGTPVPDVEVKLSPPAYDKTCQEAVAVTKTNANGQFAVGPITRFEWFVGLIGDRVYAWNLCVVRNGTLYSGFYKLDTGYMREEVVALTCRIDASTKPYHSSLTGAELERIQICRET